ncbi:MAG: glycosyltransferase [Bacteroidales bacterium]|jgi:glycosyltransferase involved in cell wall biosynthesis|nr:glycosyltransferase [Bacteroidales bacterium]
MFEYFNTEITPISTALIALFVVCLFMLFRFYIKYSRVVGRYKSPELSNEKKPVSVVISCKNEFEYIKQHLPFWLEQKYSNFEIVAVCDEKDEEILTLLRSFQQHYAALKVVKISSGINFFDEEKFALSIGAKEATHEYLIFTTISSRPASEYCIDYMQSAFEGKTNVVLGHAIFGGNASNAFSRYLYADSAIRSFASAIAGYSSVGSHRLLGYKKNSFLETGGYTNHYSLETGVYDFLPAGKKVAVQISPDSVVKVAEDLGWSTWKKEEKNYFVAFSCSQGKPKKEEVWYRISLLLFYATTVLFLTTTEQTWNSILLIIFLILIFVKISVQLAITAKAMKNVSEKSAWIFAPLFELLYLPNVIFSFFRMRRA